MKKTFLFLILVASFSSLAFSDEVITVTSAYTTTADDETILCDASSGAVTITLLDCRTNTILTQKIKKIDNSANACTLDGTGSQTIDGSATLALSSEHNAVTLQCDGANWRVYTGTGSAIIPGTGGVITDAEVPDDITIDGTDNVTLESIEGSTDDSVLVNNGTDWQEKVVPDCDNGTNDKLLYDQTTNAFTCGTDQGGSGGTLPVADTASIVEGSADATKEIRFEVDGVTTGTIRVITPPDADFTMAGQNITNQFTVSQTFDTVTPIVFEGATADTNETTVNVVDPTADRTFTIPNDNSMAGVVHTGANVGFWGFATPITGTVGAGPFIGGANQLRCVRREIEAPYTIDRAIFNVSTFQVGANCGMCLYNTDGTALVASGVVACNSNGIKTITFTPVTVEGSYWFCWTADNSSVQMNTIILEAEFTAIANTGGGSWLATGSNSSGGVCPSSTTFTDLASDRAVPIVWWSGS